MRLTLVLLIAATWLVVALALAQSSCTPPGCADDASCGAGNVCTDGACTSACAADTPCPQGKACIARDDGSLEGVCLAAGTFAVGEACTDDRECVSGACAGEEGGRVCVDACEVTGPAATCPNADERCTLEGLRRVCVPPLDSRATGEQCNSPRECTSGTCIVPPGDGAGPEEEVAICAENCANDLACPDEDLICVRLTGGARACLAPLVDGATCQVDGACVGGFCIEDVDDILKCASACDDGACADGFACDVDDAGNDVCMPILDTREAGEACERARECASGHCAHFSDSEQDFGTLCADPCDADGECGDALVCWSDPGGTDVCGPAPEG